MTRLTDTLNTALKYIYPPSCPYCGEVLEASETDVCAACKPRLSYVKEPTCFKCGCEIEDGTEELCADCRRVEHGFVRGFSAFNYVDPADKACAAFKYRNGREYAAYFAGEIIKKHGKHIKEIAPEVLVPVPIHKRKLNKRGYNQAELLARELSRITGIPVDTELIIRKVNTPPQKKYDPVKRANNVKTAFISSEKIVQYKSAMLVDDIYTTGATIDACTAALKGMGIEKTYFVSICIGKGY
ncbi:MAG: ComF family protein [Lachnospiraceae bacterium]|nr:ComF family protein [Lachnospiraceae bacterium]